MIDDAKQYVYGLPSPRAIAPVMPLSVILRQPFCEIFFAELPFDIKAPNYHNGGGN